MTADLYETLGVEPDATEAEIAAAFRQAAKVAHPDAGGDAERFGALVKAHKVLRDPKRRARYDATGEAEEPRDETRAKALATLDRLLDDCLSTDQSGRLDYVETMRRKLTDERDQLLDQARQAKALRERFERIEKRFVVSAGANLFAGMLATKRCQIDESLTAAEGEIALREAALEILAGYRFIVEPPRPAPTTSFSFSNVTTTTA